jgi:hypothetical protein
MFQSSGSNQAKSQREADRERSSAWGRHVSQKRRLTDNGLHGVILQNTSLLEGICSQQFIHCF